MLEPGTKEFKTQPEMNKVTPKELAESWLDFKKDQIQKSLVYTEKSIAFHRTYKSSLPSAPGEGPGSMDYYDYEVSALGTEQWEDEREEMMDYLEGKHGKFLDELEEIHGQAKKVAKGDTELIEELVIREKERRAAIEEKRREEERKKKG